MNKAEKEAAKKLRRIVNGNIPDCRVSITYTEKPQAKAQGRKLRNA